MIKRIASVRIRLALLATLLAQPKAGKQKQLDFRSARVVHLRTKRSQPNPSPSRSGALYIGPGVHLVSGLMNSWLAWQRGEEFVMSLVQPKPLHEYPFYVRWVFRHQARKYGRTLAPSWLWGRLPGHFLGLLFILGLFQRKRFPVDTALRSLVSARVAQLNGCGFCMDLNAYNLLQATGSRAKAEEVDHWRDSSLYSERERAALDYAEAMTDTARRVTQAQIFALQRHFDNDGVVALTAWIAFQNLSAKFNSALGAEESGLCKLPGPPPDSATRPN